MSSSDLPEDIEDMERRLGRISALLADDSALSRLQKANDAVHHNRARIDLPAVQALRDALMHGRPVGPAELAILHLLETNLSHLIHVVSEPAPLLGRAPACQREEIDLVPVAALLVHHVRRSEGLVIGMRINVQDSHARSPDGFS